MSQDFMDPEIFADFIVEAKEHLETIEPNLLELEKEPENISLLNEIFRPMHSLKGASGFLGLNKINNLAHRAENVMDELRKGDMSVTADIMDIILSATDALRQMIENLETEGTEGDVETESICNRLDAVLAGEISAAPEEAPAPPPDAGAEPVVNGKAPEQDIKIDESAMEQADSSSSSSDSSRPSADADLPEGETYSLTAFGEDHLRDFIEEARDITQSLQSGLLELEKDPHAQGGELVNDLFRYFHNLKGNSGIIGFNELNSLTHEAETLLNRVRKGEMQSSHELVDLLLYVVDIIETLVERIETSTGSVTPLIIDVPVGYLQRAVNDGIIEAPSRDRDNGDSAPSAASEGEAAASQPPAAEPEVETPATEETTGGVPDGYDEEDVAVFAATIHQQQASISLCVSELQKDSEQKEYIDALYRSLVTVQNSSGYMGLDDIKVHAERTAGLVDTARSSDMDFGLMLDILGQEIAILDEILVAALDKLGAANISLDDDDDAPEGPSSSDEKIGEKIEEKASSESAEKADVKKAEASKTPQDTEPSPVKSAVQVQSEPETPVVKPVETPVVKPAAPSADKQPEKTAASKPASSGSSGSSSSSASGPKAPAAKPAPKPQAAKAPAAAPAAAPAKPKTSSTIRVDHEKLDHLMNLIGELIINRNRYSMLARHLEDEQNVDVAEVAQSLTETTYAMARISDDLQDTIMKVRMVPVSSVFSRFPRLVRDLSRKSGKEVDLIMEGEETELDKSVVEVIGDPLVNLIRNAMDHGIESEQDRIAAGKNAKGSVWLRAYHKGNSVAIEIEDDGKGIDPEKMREVAIRKGIVSPEEAKALDDREAMELIFAPGFSSAETITDISGRGVGMDVVRNNIKNLKGSVSITSEIGKGTKFTLSLPLTLAIIDALMVNVAGEIFAIPLDAVSETTKIEARRLTDVNNRKAVTMRGQVMGIVELAELLEMDANYDDNEVLSVVVIHDNDRRLGLVVDRMLERQEIVIKPLGAYLGDLKGISGATIMGDGSVILILDPHEVYMMATSKAI